MKLLLLGVALLSVCQVRGDEDLLHSLFGEKIKELKQQKVNEPDIIVSAAPDDFVSAAPDNLVAAAPVNFAAVADDKSTCNVQQVVDNGTQLAQDTLGIIADTFKIIYTTMYPASGREDCTLGTFRCILREFNDVQKAIKSVKNKVYNYKDHASSLSTGITNYFTNCHH